MRDIDRNINSQLYTKKPETKELTVKQISRQSFIMKSGTKKVTGNLINVKFKNKIYYLRVTCVGALSELTKITLNSGAAVLNCSFMAPQEDGSLGGTTGVIISDELFTNIQVTIEKETNVSANTNFIIQIFEEL